MDVARLVLAAHNGQGALDQLATHCAHARASSPALLFLDVKLPVLDGFGFVVACQRLPVAQQHPNVVVMLTTSPHPLDRQRIGALPIAQLRSKSLAQEKIASLLEQYFG